MTTAARRPGRPPSLRKAARAVLRERGLGWLAEAKRAADLGDAGAVELIVSLASLPPERTPNRTHGQ